MTGQISSHGLPLKLAEKILDELTDRVNNSQTLQGPTAAIEQLTKKTASSNTSGTSSSQSCSSQFKPACELPRTTWAWAGCTARVKTAPRRPAQTRTSAWSYRKMSHWRKGPVGCVSKNASKSTVSLTIVRLRLGENFLKEELLGEYIISDINLPRLQ